MRPEILFPLFAPVTALPGVGPRIGKLIEQLAGARVVDLCWHLPSGLVDRRFSPALSEAPEGAIITVTVTVDRHEKPRTPRLPYRVRCHDATGSLTLVFFNAKADWLEKTLPIGETRVVSGRVERYQGELQMAHPDHVVPEAEAETVRRVEPVYPLTAGLTPRLLAKAVRAAVDRAPELPEWIDAEYLKRQGWAGWRSSLTTAHTPAELADLEPTMLARQRLAFDELLASQLALALVRARQRKLVGRRLKGDGSIRARIAKALPFSLTGSQKTAIAEIEADMAGPAPMLRLLQGDVGSGKTVVALMAMAIAVEAGAQAALLAPTDILARQHLATISPLAEAAGLRVGLLTGRDRAKARADTLAGLADGSIPIVVGTHALVQEDVEFRDLGLAVIDEQHRFGVHQRLLLAEKGKGADVLVMTATPIPRTLMLTAYGDLDVSRLTEKPAGRQPIDTRAVPLDRIEEVVAAVGRGIADGARAYWICPLVEESEAVDLANAEARFADLSQRLPVRVGLVHGQQKAAERDAAMTAFSRGDIDILVATTVVEVGVDVPAATIMVIEHAERFGLAQLHQLRGRIGRGAKRSTCLLLYQAPLGETAKARLKILRETDDGFRIAEEDLRLRGAGELLGTRQSGLPDFRLANIAQHGELLAAARDDARLILERDPDLAAARGQALRVLLYLFERDAVVKTVRSG
ncbi:ATP-dependent DNA helicase RecG [Hypericibacter sp.]|uniref:ATP-dependent DNA helicase RecG n=1 Tax=Hypericibacter sp. TaxID=2705401 RepID=UPI003D6DA6A7